MRPGVVRAPAATVAGDSGRIASLTRVGRRRHWEPCRLARRPDGTRCQLARSPRRGRSAACQIVLGERLPAWTCGGVPAGQVATGPREKPGRRTRAARMVRSRRPSAPRGRGDRVRSEELIAGQSWPEAGAAQRAAFGANPGVDLDPCLEDPAGSAPCVRRPTVRAGAAPLVPQPATFAPMAPPLADPSTVEALTSRILGE